MKIHNLIPFPSGKSSNITLHYQKHGEQENKTIGISYKNFKLKSH